MTILMVFGVEIASKLLVFIRMQFANVERDSRIHADAYDKSGWAEEYFNELNALPGFNWHPYVYWRRVPYKGKYTNIDQFGLRQTWKGTPKNGSPANPVRIFMFGGSTLWGTGAQDDETIPSLVAKLLTYDYGLNVEVTNFGASGYVTTQEMIALMRELQRGNVPELVVFYDGANDTFSTFQNNGVAGLPQNEANREREFNLLRPQVAPRLYKEAFRTVVQNSSTYQVLRSLVRRATGHELPEGAEASPTTPASAERIGSEVARIYAWNVKLVRSIGQTYGFKTLFYWQPVIFNKDKRTPYEREVYDGIRSIESFYRESTAQVKSLLTGFEGFQDISAVFKGDTAPYFIDPWHIAGSGDRVIARRMMKEIGPIAVKLATPVRAKDRF